jgi:hypothetical protein
MKRSIELRNRSHQANALSASVVLGIAGATATASALSNIGEISFVPMLFRKPRVQLNKAARALYEGQ